MLRTWFLNEERQALFIVVVPMLIGLTIALLAWSSPVKASAPSDEARALERIANQLDKINDTLKNCK